MPPKKILLFCLLAPLWLAPAVARADDPDPARLVITELVGRGYDVLDAGLYPDSQGQPRADAVYARMDTITNDLDNDYIEEQALDGSQALGRNYPHATNLITILQYARWQIIFQTSAQDLDQYRRKQIKTADYWSELRSNARIYDTVAKEFVGEKDFVNKSQVDKNQTSKDFSKTAPNPLPTPVPNSTNKPEHILLEPSTTYLPADSKSQVNLLARLSDAGFNPLSGHNVNFGYEAQGQSEKNLGAASTDADGTARAQVVSGRVLNVVLMRATTASLNAQVQVLVGPPPASSKEARLKAIINGLKSQGYLEADADYAVSTGPAGQAIRQAISAVRVTAKTFDRSVYSQLSRSFGTLRTVIPEANFLLAILQYRAKNGRDYSLLYSVLPDDWEAFVKGQVGENIFWQRVSYEGAVDEKGNNINDKDFVNKNFGPSTSRGQTNTPRGVESALTLEEWGEQLTVGEFEVPVGGSADGFTLADLSGNATGLAIFATPDFSKPVASFKRGDDPKVLSSLRLGQGQYVLEVQAEHAPARVQVNYVEHLAQ